MQGCVNVRRNEETGHGSADTVRGVIDETGHKPHYRKCILVWNARSIMAHNRGLVRNDTSPPCHSVHGAHMRALLKGRASPSPPLDISISQCRI